MKKFISLSLLLVFIISGCSKQEDIKPLKYGTLNVDLDGILMRLLKENSGGIGTAYFLLPESTDFSNIPQDPNNPLTPEKVELGRFLFNETGIAIHPKFDSFQQTYSCATCHHSQAGFQSGRPQGISEGGVGFGKNGDGRRKDEFCPEDSLDIQPIRTPTILNSAYQQVMLWNGQFGATGPNSGTEALWETGTPLETNFLGYEGVETQAIAGLSVHRMGISMDLINSTEYRELFDAAFPEVPENERYSVITAGLAIASYERTVLATEAPFQKYLKGNTNALTEQQKRGAILFFGKANCVSCHTGPALNSMDFYAYGMKDLVEKGTFGNGPDIKTQKGRGGFTGVDSDNYTFKVPQLYSLGNLGYLGHGSSFSSIKEVVEYKNTALKQNPNVPDAYLSNQFIPLGLTEKEMDQLTNFIEFGLYDPDLDRYNPSSVPSGNCFPNNDEQSKIDLGCIIM